MKKLIASILLLSSASFANPAEWLVCQTPGEAPNIDFSISAADKTKSSILMTVTQMSGDSVIYRAQVSAKTLAESIKTKSFYSLVFTADNSAIVGDAFISTGAIVTMANGVAKVAIDGGVYKNIKCAIPAQ